MKLLICTQVVNAADSDLGFFVRWIQEFAKHCEKVTVICLRTGTSSLPDNVEVVVLGTTRIVRVIGLLRACFARRHEYDAVFVHMNPEYFVIAGVFWRLMRKRTTLWYTHKSINLKLRIAAFWVDVICTASKESFRLKDTKVRVMGHGIDTDFFAPDPETPHGMAVLSAGRLSPTKRHDLIIRAAPQFPFEVWIAGEGPEKSRLEALVRHLSLAPRVRFLGAQTQEQMREVYRTAGVFVHTSETGSLDKVVLEALACGLPVITTSTTLSGLPVIRVSATPDAIARAVTALPLTDAAALAAYVREHHSLQHLVPAILGTILDII